MRNRKYYPHGAVLLVTSRVHSGLPLVPTLPMNFLIEGILARASNLFNIRICHYIFMGNHFHMLVVIENPQHVSDFFGYVKAETAQAVNKMLDRDNCPIWQDGFDSPILLTPDMALHYVKYIYLNPARAHLVESIDDYPGVSSLEMFLSGNHKKTCKKISRTSIEPLGTPAISIREQNEMLSRYKEKPGEEYEIEIEPFAWVECYPELEGIDLDELKEEILGEINREQEALTRERKKKNKWVLGATKLRRGSMEKEHTPKKSSPRMICISSDVSLRVRFISHFRALCDEARRVYEAWKSGNLHLKIPLGMFAPRVPLLACEVSVPN